MVHHNPDQNDPRITEEISENDIPESLPLLPVRDVVVFPYMILPLFVARDTSVKAVDVALERDQLIFLSTQKDPNVENPEPDDLYVTGTIGMVMRQLKLPDGRLKVLVQGITRARISEYIKHKPYYEVKSDTIAESDEEYEMTVELEALMRNVREASEKILALSGPALRRCDVHPGLGGGPRPPGRSGGQQPAAEDSRGPGDPGGVRRPINRLELVHSQLGKELEVSTMQAKIQSEAQEEMSKSQREYYLREQIRAIRRELGDAEDRSQELDEPARKRG